MKCLARDNLPIVVVDITPWKLRPNRAQSLARGFASLGRWVTYIEYAPLYRYARQGRGVVGALFHSSVKREGKTLVCEAPSLPVANHVWLHKCSVHLARHRLVHLLKQAVVPTEAIWLLAHPITGSVLKANSFHPQCIIYDVADDWQALTGERYQALGLAECERSLANAAEYITAVSPHLARVIAERLPYRSITLVPNGVDCHQYAGHLTIAPEIARLPRPVLGLVGTLGSFVDVSLLEAVARHFLAASLVLVGPIEAKLTPLAHLPNVHMVGPQPPDRIPSFVCGFDVGLNPRPLSAAAIASDPTKIYEYLAAGVPVVSSPLGERNDLGSLVLQAETPRAFCAAIESLLTGGVSFCPEEAKRVARRNTWTIRCTQILELCSGKRRPYENIST